MSFDDLDTYNVDVSDDPFDEDPPSPKGPSNSKKRKEATASATAAGGLGLDEEVSVVKRARAPAVRLDEARLLSDAGIPKLRRTAASTLKFKGKGHEFGDAARLLSFYQLWLDDLFPKARFLDALAMVEKVGHKKTIVKARVGWIEEERRKQDGVPHHHHLAPNGEDDDGLFSGVGAAATRADDEILADAASMEPADVAADAAATDGGGVPETPPPRQSSVPTDDQDLYGATPGAKPLHSLFGNPSNKSTGADAEHSARVADEEDLDALMAEAEMAEQGAAATGPKPGTATGQDAMVQGVSNAPQSNEFTDEEAAIAEMDAW